MAQTPEPDAIDPPLRRRSRVGLFLPYVLLLALAVMWSAGWVYIRARAASELDAWLAREAAAGRTWTCADRSLTGYPFRLELRCSSVAFARADGRFTVGPLTAVVQVYQPRHGLVQVAGPFHAEQGPLTGDVTWNDLEGSFHGASDGFVRASLVVDQPKGRVRGSEQPGEPGPIDVAAKHLELHARPTPGRFDTDGAVDVSVRLAQAQIPQLDAAVGSADPADIDLDATIDRATVLGTGTLARELDKWRGAGGRLDVAGLSIAKGDRRVQAKGGVGLDDAHRLAGQFDLRAAGLEALIGQIMGQRFGASRGALIGNLVGGLLAGMQRRERPDPAGPAVATPSPAEDGARLQPLPPLRLADGRVLLGPLAIPNVALTPLY